MDRPRFSLRWFLFSFQGRIGRLAYWAYVGSTLILFFGIVTTVIVIGDAGVGGKVTKRPIGDESSTIMVVLLIAFTLIYSWTNYAVLAKRWHDRDKSGWWSAIGFVPYLGAMWILVECGFLKGTEGSNRFGDDPNPEYVASVFE